VELNCIIPFNPGQSIYYFAKTNKIIPHVVSINTSPLIYRLEISIVALFETEGV